MIFLQETHSTKTLQRRWRNEWGGPVAFSHGTSNSRGVAILFNKSFNFQLMNTRADEEGRSLEVRIKYEDFLLTLVNVYAPNEDRPEFFRQLFHNLTQLDHKEIIFGGDLNLVLDLLQDKEGGRSQTHINSQRIIKAYMEELELVDIWRERNPGKKVFTWKGTRSNAEVRVRLDYFLITETMSQLVAQADIKPSFKSDHAQPFLEINLDKIPRGKGTWKLNVSLLKENSFLTQANELIDEELNAEYESARHRWEVIKMRTRGLAIKVSAEKKRDRNSRLRLLESKLSKIEQEGQGAFTVFWSEQEITEHKLRLHQEIEEIIEYRTRGASLRCKANWAQYGSKPSRYFLNLEKKNYQRRNISRLYDEDLSVCTELEDLQRVQVQHFSKLYRGINIDDQQIDDFFLNLEGPKLSDKQRQELDLPITKGELSAALKNMENFKTPGPDGFCSEFFKCFWIKLRDPLWEAMKEAWKFGFDKNMSQSLISLIGKKYKDLLHIDNWRPIHLLNVDYKIVAKAIANRLKKVLPSLIDSDQKGFVPGRFIGENLLDLLGTVDFCNQLQEPSLLISFDYKSAFDSVNLNYLDRSLQFFGFGTVFRQYLKTLYQDISISIQNNGYNTKYIPLRSGLRQGCVMSPSNFVLALQPLILKIKQAQNVAGISISPTLMKMFGLFADDIWSTILGTQENLNKLLDHFDRFSQASGLSLNYNKTQIMRMGTLKDSDAEFYTARAMNWVHNIKILGINFGTLEAFRSNFENIIEKIRRTTQIWSHRSLNLMGKIVVCNNLLMSIPVYQLMMVASPPRDFFIQIKKIVLEFLWDGKPARIRYTKLIKSKWLGGLSLIDLELKNKACKLSWIPRILKNPVESWAKLAYQQLPISNELIWHCNISGHYIDTLFDSSNFWIQVWKYWAELKQIDEPINRDEVLNQVIWLNDNLLRKGKPWISTSMHEAGIDRIYDIYDETNNVFLTYDQVCTKFNQRINWLHFNAIIAAIPNKFRLLLTRNTNTPSVTPLLEIVMSKREPSRYLSQLVRFKVEDRDSCLTAWNNDLGVVIDENSWSRILVGVYTLTVLDDLRWFQFRLIHRILTTNVLRSKYDASITNRCEFCREQPETVTHLLVNCRIVKKFWSVFTKWISYIFKINLELDAYTIIMNEYTGQGKQMINMMILVAKKYIYSSKCLKNRLNFAEYSQIIARVYALEKTIAIRSDTLAKHDKKWYLFGNL